MTLRILFILGILISDGLLLLAEDQTLIDFDTKVIPILTKAGCNSGACHGAAAGRGEFYLSLYGSKPEADFTSIVHHLQGRRINLSQPANSLLLAKPTEMIKHGGGTRFDLDSNEVRILTAWIQQGAERRNLRNVTSFAISPQQYIFRAGETDVDLRAVVVFDDNSSRDVTEQTIFTAEDTNAVKIDPQTGLVNIIRPGRHVVIARYLQFVEPVILFAPNKVAKIDVTNLPVHNFIDEEINNLLEIMRIPPSPQADEFTLLRRVQLDLSGRLPSPNEIQTFTKDQNLEKRNVLLNSLINSEEFNDFWTYEFAKLLRIRSQPQDSIGAETYHKWLHDQISQRTPYDDIARNLLTALGDSHQVGAANFFRTVSGPREQAEFVSELLMGARLRCANCHDHPLDQWTQDDYHGLAAIFAKVESGRVVKISESGEVVHPATGDSARPRIPGQNFLEPGNDGRLEFSAWLTQSENDYFARAIVNRLWKRLMGRGLVEPVDDLRKTNPATHPKLLQMLANDFIDHDYDLRHTIYTIASSAAYSRSGSVLPENANDRVLYSHAIVKPLHSEVLADAIADATGIPFQFGTESETMKAIEIVDPRVVSPELDLLGRCSREDSCENNDQPAGGLSLMLHLLNGELLNQRILDHSGRLNRLLQEQKINTELINELYLTTFSRYPTDKEMKFWLQEIANSQSERERRQMFQDLFWALMVSEEFQTNH